ncbi:MAG: uracil-DNA glycosylase [Acidimicrobiales bacterium]
MKPSNPEHQRGPSSGGSPSDTAFDRRERLKVVYRQALACVRCPLSQTRNKVVFGAGNANADLMFVGEAPGASEDKVGLPFVGAAGKLLDELLGGIGMVRSDVFIANVLKCRPPGNRDPRPDEIRSCESYLHSQVALIQPKVICTLGNFSTKLLRGDPTGISRLHGRAERLELGSWAVTLFPIHHPAAALYTPSLRQTLAADFSALAGLLAAPASDQPAGGDSPFAI